MLKKYYLQLQEQVSVLEYSEEFGVCLRHHHEFWVYSAQLAGIAGGDCALDPVQRRGVGDVVYRDGEENAVAGRGHAVHS